MLVDDIAKHLEAQGIGEADADIMLSAWKPENDTLDLATLLLENPGEKPVGTRLKKPYLQVITRAPDYASGMARMEAIEAELHLLKDARLGGVRYYLIEALSGPAEIAPDSMNRRQFSQNYRVLKEGGK